MGKYVYPGVPGVVDEAGVRVCPPGLAGRVDAMIGQHLTNASLAEKEADARAMVEAADRMIRRHQEAVAAAKAVRNRAAVAMGLDLAPI